MADSASATFNNTVITLTDKYGNTISWASAGMVGFKGSRKNTPFAATQAAQKAAEDAMARGLAVVEVRIKGPGGGLLPKYLDIVIGRTARKDIEDDYPITWDVI